MSNSPTDTPDAYNDTQNTPKPSTETIWQKVRKRLQAVFASKNPEEVILNQHFLWQAVRDWSVSADIANTLECLHMPAGLLEVLGRDETIVAVGAGSGGLTHDLQQKGFVNSFGYGDKLYGDTLLLIQRGLEPVIGHLRQPSPQLYSYIVNAFFDHIRKCADPKGNKTKGNAYGTNPDIFGDFVLTSEMYCTFFRNIGTMLSDVIQIPFHGEFDGDTDEATITAANDLYLRSKEDLDTLFGRQEESGKIGLFDGELGANQMDFASPAVKRKASYPSNMIIGKFGELSGTLRGAGIDMRTVDLMLDKRSFSHLGDDAYYRAVTDAIRMLKPGGAFISDGFFESYSGVFRDPILLKEYFARIHEHYDIHVVMVADTHTNPDKESIPIFRPGSLVITRKGAPSKIVDKLRTSGQTLREIKQDTQPYWYIEEESSQYQKLLAFTDSVRQLIRLIYPADKITPELLSKINQYLRGSRGLPAGIFAGFSKTQEERIPYLDYKVIAQLRAAVEQNCSSMTIQEKVLYMKSELKDHEHIEHFISNTFAAINTLAYAEATN